MFLWYQETLDKERLDEKAREVRELLLDPDLLDRTEALLKREKNPISKRKADRFLPLINGEKVKISERSKILMRSKNRNLRKEAHQSWKPLLDSIEKQARESIKLANKLA